MKIKPYLLAFCLLQPSMARAQQAAPSLQRQMIEATPEVLNRWGIAPEAFASLDSDKQISLRAELTQLEFVRLRKIELLKQIDAANWRTYITSKGLITEEGEKLLASRSAELKLSPLLVPASVKVERADGKPLSEGDLANLQSTFDFMYDNVASRRDPSSVGSELVFNVHVRNGGLEQARVTDPKTGVSVEVGQLGLDGRHPLLKPSWYVNARIAGESDASSAVDYRVSAQLGLVDLNARYFSDDGSGRSGPDRLIDWGRRFGISDEQLNKARRYVNYDDAYKSQKMVVASLMSQVGRAYNLVGPVDVSWTIGNLTKVMYLAPNTAFDETLGIRVRLKDNDALSLGIFGGATQNISPVGNNLISQAVSAEQRIATGFFLENAPHATVALWGKIPGADTTFQASVGQRFNNDTTVTQAELALSKLINGKPLTLRGTLSKETGTEIGFDRQKAQIALEYQLGQNARAFVAYEVDNVKYGNAQVDSSAFMLGLEVFLGGSQNSLTTDAVVGGEYKGQAAGAARELNSMLRGVNQTLTDGVRAADAATALYRDFRGIADMTEAQLRDELPTRLPQLQTRLDQLSVALWRLGPDVTGRLVGQLNDSSLSASQKEFLGHLLTRTVSDRLNPELYRSLQAALNEGLDRAPGDITRALERLRERLQSPDEAVAYYAEHRKDLVSLIGLISSPKTWDDIVVRAARTAMIRKLSEGRDLNIPVLGGHIDLTAGAIMMAGNVFMSRLSPERPAQPGELDARLLREAGEQLDIDADRVTPEMIADRIVEMAVDKARDAVKDNLKEFFDSLPDTLVYDRQALTDKILTAVPPAAVNALRQRYGDDLAGLLPPLDATTQEARQFVMNRLPELLTEALQEQMTPAIARQVGRLVAFTSNVLRRELNMTLIQLMLASEELNKITIDGGRKIDEHNRSMAMFSYNMLDRRSQLEADERLRTIKNNLINREMDDRVALEVEQNKNAAPDLNEASDLAALQQQPSWPKGLSIVIDEQTWPWMVKNYGRENIADLVERIRTRYELMPRPQGSRVVLSYDPAHETTSGMSMSHSSPVITIQLAKPSSPKDAVDRLKSLELITSGNEKPRI